MKKILFFILAFVSLQTFGQSKIYLRGDSVQFERSGGNSELILLNGSRSVTNGILTNIGNGRTKFLPIDSFAVGGNLSNLGSGYSLAVEGTSDVKTLLGDDFGISLDSTETEGTLTIVPNYSILGRFGVPDEDAVNEESVAREFDMNLGSFRFHNGALFQAETISADENITAGVAINAADITEPISISATNDATGVSVYVATNLEDGSEVIGLAIEDNEGDFNGINFTLNRDTARLVYETVASPVSIPALGDRYRLLARDSITGAIADFTGTVGGFSNPLTTTGDIIYSSDGSGTPARLGIGSENDVLVVSSGIPAWAAMDLQRVLAAGGALTGGHTVDQDGFLITWSGPNRWTDADVTQVSQIDFNSGIDYFITTPILGDTAYDFTGDVVNGWRMAGTHDGGSTTSYLQVKGNGIFFGGLSHINDTTSYKVGIIDPATGELVGYSNWLGAGGSSLTVGSDNQIPYSNSGGTDFDYNSGFTFDGTTLTVPVGSASTPGLYFNGNLAGIYSASSQQLNFSINGSERARITGSILRSSSGNWQLNGANGAITGTIGSLSTLTLSSGSASPKVGGSLVNNVTSVSTSGSSEVDLQTYSLPAATLGTNGDYIEVKTYFIANAAGQTIKVLFGATEVVSYTTTTSGGHWIEGVVTRTGAATQHALFAITANTASVTQETTPAETLSGAITIKGTGNATSLGNLSQNRLNVKYYPN